MSKANLVLKASVHLVRSKQVSQMSDSTACEAVFLVAQERQWIQPVQGQSAHVHAR